MVVLDLNKKSVPAKSNPPKFVSAPTNESKTAKLVSPPKVEEPKVDTAKMLAEAQAAVDACNLDKWEHIGLKQILSRVERAHIEQKYVMILDKQGMAARFFQYQGILVDLESDIKKLGFKMTEPKAITEKMRFNCVEAMRCGRTVVYDFEAMDCCPRDFNDEKEMPFDVMLDWQMSRDHATYNKIVLANEKFDLISREVDGYFFMKDKFM